MLSLFLTLLMIINSSLIVFASSAQLEHPSGTTSYQENIAKGKLIDSQTLYYPLDENKNISSNQLNSIIDTVVAKYDFYYQGQWDGRYHYEVQMEAYATDPSVSFLYHNMQIKPSGNTGWWKHQITRPQGKTIINDAMNYDYGEPQSNPSVQVKLSLSTSAGNHTFPTKTLKNPIHVLSIFQEFTGGNMELNKITDPKLLFYTDQSEAPDENKKINFSSTSIKVYTRFFKTTGKHSLSLKEMLIDNPILQVILLTRYSSPIEEGFSYPVCSPVHIFNILNNPLLPILNDLFSYVNVSADSKKSLVYDITCGPLKAEVRKELSALLDSDFFHPELKLFFPEYNFEYPSEDDFPLEYKLFQNPSEVDSPVETYQIHFTKQNEKKEPEIFSHPLLHYIACALSLFDISILRIPYHGRTMEQIENDVTLKKIVSITRNCYLLGSKIDSEWTSHCLILKELSLEALTSFQHQLWR